MIPAEELLNLLQERDLVPPEVIQELRNRAAEASRSPKPLSAAMAAKILVDQGYLSRLLAQRLMAAVEQAHAEKTQRHHPEPIVLKKVEPLTKKTDDDRASAGEDEGLELAPLEEADDLFGTPSKKKTGRGAGSREQTGGEAPAAAAKKQPAAGPQATYGVAGGASQGLDASVPAGPENLFEDLGFPGGSVPTGPPPLADPFASLPRRRNRWDSPLLLLGGGALLLLIFVGVIVLFSLNRRSGDELLAEAEADYRAGSYTQAIHKYQRFLKDFPKHPQAGVTRVRVGLAQIRQTLSGDWLEVWQNTRRVLEEIAVLPDFHPEADAELTAVLPQIGEGLAASAFERADEARIEAAEQVLSAIRRYVPRESRPGKKIADIENTLQLARRRIALNQERTAALGKIREARARGAADEAYEIRRRLVRQFPQLADDEELAAEMSEMCGSLRDGVVREDIPSAPPVETDRDEKVQETAFFALLREGRAPVAEDQFLLMEAEGCVFCLAAATGQLVWQRYVGGAPPNGLPPAELPQVEASGVRSAVLLDHRRHALVWVELATGKELRAIKMPGETAWGPRLIGDAILVGGADSGWFVVDAATGEGLRAIRFPVAVRLPPAVSLPQGDALGPLWFAAAEHSYTFVLSESGRKTEGVIYTGHDRGALVLPPVAMDRYLLLPEVLSNDAARIAVWRWNGESGAEPVQQLAPVGRLGGPLQVAGNRLLLETADADVMVFELRGDPKTPLVRIAEGKTASPKSGGTDWEVPRYVLLEAGILLAADTALTRFDLQAAAGRIVPQWVAAENMPVIQPPRIVGDAVFHVYRRAGQAGVFAAAVSVKDGSFYWETRLADPLPLPPRPEDGALRASTVGGSVCLLPLEIDAGASTSTPVRLATPRAEDPADALPQPEPNRTASQPEPNHPAAQPQPSRKVSQPQLSRTLHRVPLPAPGIEAAAAEGRREIEIREADGASWKVRRVPLPMEVAGPIARLGREVVVPLRNGSLARIDWAAGRLLGDPYQTPVTPGKSVLWTMLLALPENRVAAAREDGRLWLLSAKNGGWTVEHEIPLQAALIPPAAVLKTHLFAMDAGRRLTAVNLQTGQAALRETVDERPVWGPFSVGERVWLGTAKGDLLAWDDRPAPAGRRPAGDMPWVGPPVAWRNHLLAASICGELLLLEPEQGTIVDRVTLDGVPVAGPGVWQDWAMVGLRDGRAVRMRLDRLAAAQP
ncbi:MAG: hypothetical protein GYA33_05090 [Thermogutta sp.]|nr:hypothetical protein [Thermogutta sp.]